MSAALLDDLLSGFVAPTPANPANPANREHPCVPAADSGRCEGLRISANSHSVSLPVATDSQVFAAVRNPLHTLGSEELRGLSQDSQLSQGAGEIRAPRALDLAAVAWADADIARFLDRRTRLLRWGWSERAAEALAEKLVIRDREADPRVICGECSHYRPGRCGNHRRAGLYSPEVGRDLAALLQRCLGFKP